MFSYKNSLNLNIQQSKVISIEIRCQDFEDEAQRSVWAIQISSQSCRKLRNAPQEDLTDLFKRIEVVFEYIETPVVGMFSYKNSLNLNIQQSKVISIEIRCQDFEDEAQRSVWAIQISSQSCRKLRNAPQEDLTDLFKRIEVVCDSNSSNDEYEFSISTEERRT
ncbi:hypothetical protein WA026_000338 [Henosepilachna vigintioctopunctata]|uniref:Uncharacterized protein n=1 Tax=Henosepilachna vigintioctopunctata TaxID=420089 RepID=A0AAW1V6Y4_9CUCU